MSLALFLTACTYESPTAAPEASTFTVKRVVDGDTIVVEPNTTVRLLEIDTPETVHPQKPVECFGPEASARTKQLLHAGETVRLEYERERIDRYGRDLAQVFRQSDGLHINASLVQDGYAKVTVYKPNNAYETQFRKLEADARKNHRGIWGSCPY